jgi:tRNA(Ile2) C34 agmatinyltransferase TiaS
VTVAAVATREATVTERPPAEASAPRLFEPGGVTLEDAVLEVWEDLVTHGRAECPVCGGPMSAAGGCESCGAELG